MDLLSINSRVAVPLIIVQIGDYSFGLYDKTKTNLEINGRYYAAMKVTYPNYMESLKVTKVNGTLNSYVLTIVYPITQNDDPNMMDKVFSSVSSSRKIVFTYGDCATPSFMYRNEEAIITNVRSTIDIASSKITYTVEAVSSSLVTMSGTYNFNRYANKKPSELIKQILFTKTYGLQDVFYGMHSREQVEQLGLILGDDRAVTIEAKKNITILDYLNYLVSCMSNQNDKPNATEKTTRYVLTIHDDTSGLLDGPYFRINKIYTDAASSSSIDYYQLDIGYPNKDLVVQFSVDDDQSYPLLYNYASTVNRNDYVYRIDDTGGISEIYSPSFSNSNQLYLTTEADRTYWAQLTQFPIHATLQIRGLLRAIILMSYIRINTYIFGKPFNGGTGLFLVTKQVDNISKNGYTTTLSLVRVGNSESDS